MCAKVFRFRYIVLLAMDEAFDRLTDVQKENINHDMFIIAFNCIARSKYDHSLLERIIVEETIDCPHMLPDLKRYCKLVESVR